VRASSAVLALVLLVWAATAVRLTSRLLLAYGIGFLMAVTVWAGLQQQPLGIKQIAEPLYGNQLDQDLTTFSGRTEVWKVAEPLISHSLLLGYGMGGFRDVLLKETSWPAGNAHNSLLELILTGGLPATVVVFLGWAGSARRAWLSGKRLRLRTLGIYVYMILFGITAPNLMHLQFVGMFLIITLDSMLYAESCGAIIGMVRQ
jgi:O-antigen ligase